ncbi:P-loop containing nucleoside triphosphate hydrolase protein [Mycena maculata]|uniref:DNA 3'-5' helicase n=1 Tax=Mycena maculata TaxID=230809 RepID=A0AAD7MJ92_9AGAR|nr:P-loop containing nucleoside triphosphate hydrolase protein [Mycena maculata]
MPYKPLAELDAVKLENASKVLCDLFKVPSLHPHQSQTGQNTLRGISTVLDIPTGGGKTLAFWYPLFYYWAPGNLDDDCQKIVLVVGPLTALMESQAIGLAQKGVPAIAISSTSENPNLLLKEAENKYRVALISPEMATSSKFHSTVLSSDLFCNNIISLVIDEAHCISEWGGDDFRPEFSNLSVLLARMPSGVPVVIGSATMPEDITLDILRKLRMRVNCARVAVSNEKPNVALSVRILQHPQDTFADLMTLFRRDIHGPEDFEQSLIYVEGRITGEKIQDFLRRNTPDEIAEQAFVFYHRHIDEKEKQRIQNAINDGSLRGVAATDALGMGMDFKCIMRVILWLSPQSFLSLVQKIGRCGRAAELLGEAILYITSASYMQYEIELDILKEQLEDEDEDTGVLPDQEPETLVEGEQMDREAAIEEEEEVEMVKAPKGKLKKTMSVMQLRDRCYLLEYIVTKRCRRIPWNKFFGNDNKLALPYPALPGTRCCDNCEPHLFPVETVRLTGGSRLKTGRRQQAKTSEEVSDAVKVMLTLRDDIARREWPDQHILTGKNFMSNLVVEALAARAREITSLEVLAQTVRWIWAEKFGSEIVTAIQHCLVDFPDLEQLAREEQVREKAFAALQALAEKDLRKKLTLVFDGCYDAILAETITCRGKSVKRCQVFLTLPKKNIYPDYYELIKEPISMPKIRDFSHSKLIRSTAEYSALWHRMFTNARQYNRDDSIIYQDAEYLQGIFDNKLRELAILHNLPTSSLSKLM